ncbi:hypothetical protein DN752_10225 [Echinicola strongylocentroti]|uniref:Metallo-beta-lactamase domain-containing protein n=1 Tax=Echinicola strongylocentroti TaxID=1795355 RepID=A0A2Z4IIW7_9BACT|nr:MBL fold metallo-hydrolase [Echinicola strongylocentroti]AWW30468.1 hypothetical protein DN752_10225 [Echinicola strongylocentroti]
MKFTIFLLIHLVLAQVLMAQSLTNNERAVQIINRAINSLGKCPEGLEISTSGVIHNLGHYAVPEQTIDYAIQEKIGFFPSLDLAYSHTKMTKGDNNYYRDLVSKMDSAYSWDYYDETFTKSKTSGGLVEVAKSNPSWFLYLAKKEALSLRMIEASGAYNVIAVTMKDGLVYNLIIDSETFLLKRVERMVYSPIYGDALFTSSYEGYTKQRGFYIPQRRVDYEFGSVEREVTYDSLAFISIPDTSAASLKWLPAPFINSLADVTTNEEVIVFEKLSDQIDLIKYESQNNKSLLVKFPNGLGLFEAPQGIALNKQLVSKIKERYPDQDITYLFLTHHHPDHAGGLKAYAGSGATVITTSGNTDYFKKLAHTSHYSLDEGVDDKVDLLFDYVPLLGQKSYAGIVTAYEIGEDTGHTDQHLVFYFPDKKFLWTGDLLFFYENGRVYSGSKRAEGVYKLITEKGLDVSRVYTSWPLHGQKEYGTPEFLKKLVEND